MAIYFLIENIKVFSQPQVLIAYQFKTLQNKRKLDTLF